MHRFTLRCLGEGGPPIHNRRVARILSSGGAISRSALEGEPGLLTVVASN